MPACGEARSGLQAAAGGVFLLLYGATYGILRAPAVLALFPRRVREEVACGEQCAPGYWLLPEVQDQGFWILGGFRPPFWMEFGRRGNGVGGTVVTDETWLSQAEGDERHELNFTAC